VKLQRHGIMAGLALTATLALAACGTDNNSNAPASGSGASAGSSSAISCATGTLNAQGSTAQTNAISQWTKAYQTACSGATINYNPNGSGGGQAGFIQGTADFAGSDSPLPATDQPKADARCKSGPAIHLPMVVGPIAVVFNVSGVTDLQLKDATLAKIFAGTIKTWDDPLIKADNPNATLPGTKISTVHRNDSSGTTDNFTKFLGATDPTDWTFGHDKTWKAPGGQAENKSDGVSASVKSTDGAIGYVEWSFAQVNSLSMAKIGNGAGEFAELTGDSAGKTIASAKVTGTAPDLSLSIDYKTTAAGAYPIVLVTYEIVCSKGNSSSALPLLKSFLSYAVSPDGQASAAKAGYAPLPDSIASQVKTAIGNLA
jgi:phosphate transport system substrate-binding protein